MKIQLDKILSHQLVMLSGTEHTLRFTALKMILNEALSEGGDFDTEQFPADSQEPLKWFTIASTAPFLSSKRVVVVRNLLRVSDIPKDLEIIATLPKTALVILVADNEDGDDVKQRRLKSTREAWQKWVIKNKGIVWSSDANPKELRKEISDKALESNKKISTKAIETLVEMTGGNLSNALQELDKIILYLGETKEIQEQHIKDLVIPSREWNVYKMTDAMLQGDAREALNQMHTLLASEPRPEEVIFVKIFPTISRQIKLIWQARICHETGKSPFQASEETEKCFLDKLDLRKEPDWSMDRIIRSSRNISLNQLGLCLEKLSETDSKLKGFLPSINTKETLEQMILDISAFNTK